MSLPDSLSLESDFLTIADDPDHLRILISASRFSTDIRPALVTTQPGSRGHPYTAIRIDPPEQRAGRAVIDPSYPGRSYWWSLDGVPSLWISDRPDLGEWQSATGDLARFGGALQIRRVLGHPRQPRSLLLASNLGVLISDDNGAHWQPWSDGLPAVIDVNDLQLSQGETPAVVWMASYGRGLWRRPWPRFLIHSDGFESP